MILVLERALDGTNKIMTRVVMEDGELPNISLLDIRLILRKAAEDLPSRVELLTIVTDRRKRRENP